MNATLTASVPRRNPAISHRRDCRDRSTARWTRLEKGAVAYQCRSCHSFTVAHEARDIPVAAPIEWTDATRYVCGVHQDNPVDGRGRGCSDCVVDHERRQAARRAKRQALDPETTL